MEEKQKTLLEAVFGESSDSEDSDHHPQNRLEDSSIHSEKNPSWEPISEINGLWLCRDFLSPQEQSSLLSAIEKVVISEMGHRSCVVWIWLKSVEQFKDRVLILIDFSCQILTNLVLHHVVSEGWFSEASHNQAMRFGNLPEWATELSHSIREVVLFSDYVSEHMDSVTCDGDKKGCLLPSEILWREPLFDQLILNVYQPGEGICPHVDLMRFEDGIAIISLESSCIMHFTHVDDTEACDGGREGRNYSPMTKIPVYLTPGSLVLMSGEARYFWKHEINRKPGFQIWEGQEIDQKRRTSITLRKLCKIE
ncbi:Uncharacterized protein P8A3.02c [Vitis vinifera]|uniref:Uncharacterized protein P8A3.02c n=1 Tax=Vitis vinifera TaxID=29760 RepID=A0A438F3I7_VITVI|nr:Uncharacterized protein P8A3.02c [Vitis vinifera]